jgi:hypothetical protein
VAARGGAGAPADVVIRDGVIERIGPDLRADPAAEVVDVPGRLLLTGLIDAHCHIDKTLFGGRWVPHSAGPALADRIAEERRRRAELGLPNVEHMIALLERMVASGRTHLRTHTDVVTDHGLAGVEAVWAARERLGGRVTIEQVEKLLEDGHLKLSSVISDIHGVSGRDMLNALAAGQRDPTALAQLARGTMRGKIRRLEEALDCSFFTDEHAAVLAMMLAVIDHHTTQIEALNARIDPLIEPYLHQVAQLDAVHGIGTICAQDIIAETGTNMIAFPTAAHLVSWAQWSPQVKQPAGKRKGSNATGRGNPYLSAALGEAAIGASRTHSFLGTRYRRLARRMPKKKALVATSNSILTIVHALLSDPSACYQDLGWDYYEQRMHARRQARRHVKSLERLGNKVTMPALNPDTGELLAPAG